MFGAAKDFEPVFEEMVQVRCMAGSIAINNPC
jgi:hypothetical protein